MADDQSSPSPSFGGAPPLGAQSKRLLRAGSWLAAGQLVRYVLQIAVIVLLAQLLTPEEYGLATLAFVVLSFGFVFTELGLTGAVVQKPDLTEKDLESAFWLNMGTGLVLTTCVAAAAPYVARAYGEPRLLTLLVLAGLIFSVSVGVVQTALLERAGRFKALSLIELGCTVIGWLITITAALRGFGAVSLVLGPLVQAVITSALLWYVSGWYPRGWGARASYAHVFRFGRALSGYNLVSAVAMNTDSVLVSQVAGPVALGLYNRAYNLTRVPAEQVYWLLDRVLLPTFSRLQGDTVRLQSAVLRAISFSCLIAFPALLGLAALAEPVVVGLLGERWEPMVPLLQLLAVGSAPYIATAAMRTIFTAAGETRALFRYGLTQNAITIAAILIGALGGVTGIAVALTVRAWAGLPWMLSRPMRLLGCRWTRAIPPVARVLAAALIMAGVVAFVDAAVQGMPNLARIVLGVAVGVVVYLAAACLTARAPLLDAVSLVRRRSGLTVPAQDQPAGLP